MSNINELIYLMDEAFTNGLKFELPVNGTSMLPLLHTGDFVLLEDIKVAKLKKRDVVLYQRTNGQYVLHRIYKKRGETCTMLGDNQLRKELINEKLIVAKMVEYSHNQQKVTTKDIKYRLYSFIWCIYPLRYIILKVKWKLLKRNIK